MVADRNTSPKRGQPTAELPHGSNADGDRTIETQYHKLLADGGKSTSGIPWVPSRDFDRLTRQFIRIRDERDRLTRETTGLYTLVAELLRQLRGKATPIDLGPAGLLDFSEVAHAGKAARAINAAAGRAFTGVSTP